MWSRHEAIPDCRVRCDISLPFTRYISRDLTDVIIVFAKECIHLTIIT